MFIVEDLLEGREMEVQALFRAALQRAEHTLHLPVLQYASLTAVVQVVEAVARLAGLKKALGQRWHPTWVLRPQLPRKRRCGVGTVCWVWYQVPSLYACILQS